MRAELIVTRAEEYGLPLWTAFGHIDRGWVRIARQELDAGIEELRRGLAMYEATGARLWRPYYAGLLAHALANAGRTDEARGELDAALAMAESTGEHWCVAELHRLAGEMVIIQMDGTERSASSAKLEAAVAARAEKCFERSLTVARDQRARSWELRASMSLGRLYERQAKRAEARRILSAALDLFTEGHNTQDLRDARALLSAWQSNSKLRL
jgi:predicted ATPase